MMKDGINDPLTFDVDDFQDSAMSFYNINSQYILEVERLFKLLQDNKFIEKETKAEIELTIQEYMKKMREFQTVISD